MKRFFLYIFILTFPAYSVIAQSQAPNLKETFLEAESYFLFEEFSEALPLYLRIHRADPENDNINYKIGICLLNDPFQHDKAIRYLEDASKNINPKYKDNNFKEITAPPEAFFYLGKAYLVNNNIDKALQNLNHFRDILDVDIYDVELVDKQIQICEQARHLMGKPVDFEKVNLGEKINSRFSDINPIISGDGNSMVYVSKLQFYDAAFYSEKVNGEWQGPRNIVPELGVDGDVYPTCLSWDGNTMIIYRNDEFIGNLYISHLVDGEWSTMKKLNNEISTKYWESHGSLSKDGKTLYFTSNRKDGFGGLDIYKARLQSNGTWGNPINLGGEINTRYNEETPFIGENDKIIYFSSYGHYNMGGYDIFYSQIDKQGKWGTPINLGYPINTTNDDVFFHPVQNGDNAYFSVFAEDSKGREDIYYFSVYSDNNPRLYLISGSISSVEGALSDNVNIFLLDLESKDTVLITNPDLEQNFSFKAKQGEYHLIFQSDSYEDLIRDLKIDETTAKAGIKIAENIQLTPRPKEPDVFTGENSRIVLDKTSYTAQEGENLPVKMKLEKDAKLVASVYNDSVLIQSDTFQIDKKRFTYNVTPKLGQNTLEFIMTEEDGTISISNVKVNVEKKIVETLITEEKINDILSSGETDETALEKVEKEADPGFLSYQLVDYLIPYSDGNLKKSLQNLDPQKEGIATANDLLFYLENSANSEGYTQQDIDKAVGEAVSGGDVKLLNRLLSLNGSESVNLFLRDIDSDTGVFSSIEAYVRYLRRESMQNPYTDEELTIAFAGSLENIHSAAALLKQQILQYTDDDLKQALIELDLDKEGITTEEQLIQHLEKLGISRDEAIQLGAISKVKDNAKDLRSLLLQNSEGELHEYLLNLNLENEGIESARELIEHLTKAAEMNDIKIEQLNETIRLTSTQDSKVQQTLDELLSYAQYDLHKYLSEINLDEEKIYTSKQLVNHLVEKSGDEYSDELLTNLLSSIIGDSNLENLFEYLKKYAPTPIARLLSDLDLKDAGIYDIADLVAHLIDHAVEMGYSQNELRELIVKLLADHLVDSLIDDRGTVKNISAAGKITLASILMIGILFFLFFFIRKKRKEEKEKP